MAEKKNVDYKPVTAQVALAGFGRSPVDKDAAELAEEAGVVNPAHVDYVEALENYESRDDVEPLAARRAREAGTSFSDADFVRTNSTEGVVTAETATHEDVKAAEQAKSEQAQATADTAEGYNKPLETLDNDDEGNSKSKK